ncbi:hypothetical protein CYPRO_2486 [Cyclonatronum proteinivorum]|uniref:Polysaccharide deacetylase n=1 Tax=Cyclonatronum proteinivorum TaxID=1457365 RepID=A0A345UMM6_9BACT|nr:hypothetical protein [Cyclonatronum proteinivorum]AXJ01728.1 hypothetical protein CYPRO_2486 [Cyclonatronum proteinivorum]
MEFTFEAYETALKTALSRFEHILTAIAFVSADAGALENRSVLILRHDCERDLRKALRMAELEQRLGICATYYIRVHSEYYNLMQAEERQLLRQIADMGHEVSLHYEPQFYHGEHQSLIEGIERDRAVLRDILGPDAALTTMSPHQPTLRTPDFEALARSGIVDVYTHPRFKDLSYYSDSGMKWREKTLQQAAETEVRCQFLIHPDFWNTVHTDWFTNLDQRVEACIGALQQTAAHEKEVCRNYLKNRAAHDAAFKSKVGASRA